MAVLAAWDLAVCPAAVLAPVFTAPPTTTLPPVVKPVLAAVTAALAAWVLAVPMPKVNNVMPTFPVPIRT